MSIRRHALPLLERSAAVRGSCMSRLLRRRAIVCRVSEHEYAQVRAQAAALGVSVSTLLRSALNLERSIRYDRTVRALRVIANGYDLGCVSSYLAAEQRIDAFWARVYAAASSSDQPFDDLCASIAAEFRSLPPS